MTSTMPNGPGVNILFPWSQLIATGKKTVETRGYKLPANYENKFLYIIETYGVLKPGSEKRKAQIIGMVKFSGSFKYRSYAEWREDFSRHQVNVDDQQFSYRDDEEKWGWEIAEAICLPTPLDAPASKGIKFTKNCFNVDRNI